jgi:hypothetical protein
MRGIPRIGLINRKKFITPTVMGLFLKYPQSGLLIHSIPGIFTTIFIRLSGRRFAPSTMDPMEPREKFSDPEIRNYGVVTKW